MGINLTFFHVTRASQVALVVKNPPANASRGMRPVFDPWVRKTPEKEMAIHSSILAWKIPWPGEPGGLQSIASQRVTRVPFIKYGYSPLGGSEF